jgi:hypothetical protein
MSFEGFDDVPSLHVFFTAEFDGHLVIPRIKRIVDRLELADSDVI